MRLRIPWRALALISTVTLASLVAETALAQRTTADSTLSAQPTTVTAQGISKVILVTDAAPFTVTTITQEWVDITGASAMVRVPTVWRSGLIMLRFSGDLGSCESNCAVRILVDGIEANPAVGESGVFQGVANPDVIERSIVVSTTGTHTVQVQVFVNANSFTLNDWSLVAELARVS